MKKKIVALVLVCVLVFGIAVGGTLAWLMDKTESVTNTFTVGDVDIKLEETTGKDYQVVPGVDITKNPKVTVIKDSETCYVFLKVKKSGTHTTSTAKDILTYTIDSDWKSLDGNEGVYYQVVTSNNADTVLDVITNDTITVSKELTRSELENAKADKPILTFTAYAIQKAGLETDTPAAAWAIVSAQ